MKQLETVCYKVRNKDNVATAMGDISIGEVKLTGEAELKETIKAIQDIPFGHKIALQNIKEGEYIIKYGAPIGVAICEIQKGMHVHMHNMKSNYDFRSAELDPLTAHAKDIDYKVY